MESPRTLNGYFAVVDDFFVKTFRDHDGLFVAVKTRQRLARGNSSTGSISSDKDAATRDDGDRHAALLTASSPTAVAPAPQAAAAAATTTTMASTRPTPALVHTADDVGDLSSSSSSNSNNNNNNDNDNYIAFSPRMAFDRAGGVLGKVKLALGFRVPYVCAVEQGLLLNNLGVITSVTRVRELVDGLTLALRMSVNAIAPASQDVVTGRLQYQHRDFYSLAGYQRNNLGSSNLLVDFGSSYWNCLFGAGFERQQLSYLEQKDGSAAQVDVMYGGVGFSDTNWCLAAKMTRTTDAWSTLRIAALQRLASATALAWSYTFDLVDAHADVAVGFTQGLQLRVPRVLTLQSPTPQPSRRTAVSSTPAACDATTAATANDNNSSDYSNTSSWAVIPLVLAGKAESNGRCACTLRGIFNNTTRWGVVAQMDLLTAGSRIRYGLTLSTEAQL